MTTVHILATVRKPALLDAALLVFRTLRVGFPTVKVRVWGNGLDEWAALMVATAARNAGAEFGNLPPTSHDAWIESLIEESTEPFWICDTDIVFWEAVEKWFDVAKEYVNFAGTWEPQFHEEWTDSIHVERLHTCLMYIVPQNVRAEMRRFMSSVPAPWGNSADFPFIRQHFIPRYENVPLFYDTCAGLYHAVNGKPFTERQLACFEHLHCATYADALDNKAFQEMHRRIYANIEASRGIRQQQDKYYASRSLRRATTRKRKEPCAV